MSQPTQAQPHKELLMPEFTQAELEFIKGIFFSENITFNIKFAEIVASIRAKLK